MGSELKRWIRWQPEEISFLKENSTKLTSTDIAKELNRTRKSVLKKRERLLLNTIQYKGKNNKQWKGDQVGYIALHTWIRNHKPKPFLCEECKDANPYDLANISGKYKRDIKDFEWLCRKCHMIKNGRIYKRDKGGKFVK